MFSFAMRVKIISLYGMVRYGMVWYGMVWYGMVWYGMGYVSKAVVMKPSLKLNNCHVFQFFY